MKQIYLIAAVAGAILTYAFIGISLAQSGWDFGAFFQTMLGGAGLLFTADLFASSFLFWAFMAHDAKERQIKRIWPYMVMNLTIGLITAMGAYFFVRERNSESQTIASKRLA